MGVEPFLTGAAVSGVLAQRLARKLCTHCCEMYTPSVDELLAARVSPDVAAASDGMAFYRKRGCPRCNQTGYRGRVGVYQLLQMTEDLATLAASKAPREEIERAALTTGMRTLWDDGLAKVAAGLTSIEELARVTV
jgi:type IV pilus assembly protein PilB